MIYASSSSMSQSYGHLGKGKIIIKGYAVSSYTN